MKDDIIIGTRIRQIRESMSLTREQFSELIDISASFLSQIERGEKSMSIKTLMIISLKSGYSCDYILFGDMSKTNAASRINLMIANTSDDVAEVMYNVIRPIARYIEKNNDKRPKASK